jgi:hypothetical protein
MPDFEIRLCTFENNKFEDIRVISKQIFEDVQKDIDIINEYRSHFLVFVYFQLNLIEFDSFRKKLTNIPIKKLNINKISSANNHLNSNRIIFNLLSSFGLFIDNAKSHIIRQFGQQSIESLNFTSILNLNFDNYFSYRFLYKLRNYSLHLGFPIDMAPFEAIENIVNPESMVGNFKLIVSREKIIQEKKLFGSKIIQDIANMTDDVDIIPLVNQLGKLIFKVEKHIYSLHHVKLEEAISNLKLFAGRHKTPDNKISIIFDLKEDGKYIRANTLTIPFEEIHEIEQFNKWKQ